MQHALKCMIAFVEYLQMYNNKKNVLNDEQRLYGKFPVILNMPYAKNVQMKATSRCTCSGVCIFCAVWVQSMSV